jgi:hypothetical protein
MIGQHEESAIRRLHHFVTVFHFDPVRVSAAPPFVHSVTQVSVADDFAMIRWCCFTLSTNVGCGQHRQRMKSEMAPMEQGLWVDGHDG